MSLKFQRAKILTTSIMVATILSTSCTHQQHKAPVTWLYGYGRVEKMHGSVKKLTEKHLMDSKVLIPYFAYSFDNKGDIVKIEELFKSGINVTQYSTVFDKNGKRAEAIGLYYDSGKNIREIYKYDDNEHFTRFIENANNPLTDTNRYFYDGAGNLTEQQEYFEKKPWWIVKFKYLYNKNAVCTGVEQSTFTWQDNFKTVTKDTARYVVFDSENNWLKAIDKGDTVLREIAYY